MRALVADKMFVREITNGARRSAFALRKMMSGQLLARRERKVSSNAGKMPSFCPHFTPYLGNSIDTVCIQEGGTPLRDFLYTAEGTERYLRGRVGGVGRVDTALRH